MCTWSTPSQPPTTRCATLSESTTPVTKPAYRDGPQCCHCGWRGNHSSSCPFYNPTTCVAHKHARYSSPL
ncbi:hypothetical protein B0H17DRAFT_1210107 [Mycena rosella]|uniref:Uncharacterized protein n=1 Tax=Mycena rosella TaxID=1033263 RepID=A0AAD7D0W6_MYCRO|nr:hypothetical protein B0H17DRAFT_1210107 [Mycena rosella]